MLYFGDHLYSDLAVRGGGLFPRGRREPCQLVLRSASHSFH